MTANKLNHHQIFIPYFFLTYESIEYKESQYKEFFDYHSDIQVILSFFSLKHPLFIRNF